MRCSVPVKKKLLKKIITYPDNLTPVLDTLQLEKPVIYLFSNREARDSRRTRGVPKNTEVKPKTSDSYGYEATVDTNRQTESQARPRAMDVDPLWTYVPKFSYKILALPFLFSVSECAVLLTK